MSRIDDVLAALDIQQEYELLGITGIKGRPNARGWLSCNAFGASQRTGSAAINVGNGEGRGYYHEFKSGEHLSLFDFAIKYGQLGGDFREVLKHYAAKTSIQLRGKYMPADDPGEKFSWIEYNDRLAVEYCSRKHGVTPEAMRRAGVRMGRWPAKGLNRQMVLALPIFGPNLTSAAPVGWLAWPRVTKLLEIYAGKDKDPGTAKTITPRKQGSTATWVGMDCHNLDEAEIVWKVEGYSDMLSLMGLIPEEHHGKHVVVTNANGANENPNPDHMDSVCGKRVLVIHDADVPGQFGEQEDKKGGAVRWCNMLAQTASEVRNVQLPYEIGSKHGKDLRDWIVEGGTYEALMEMANSSPVWEIKTESVPRSVSQSERESASPAGAGRIESQKVYYSSILERIQLDVLGEDEGDRIHTYSRALRKRGVIDKGVDKLTHIRLVQIAGMPAMEHVAQSVEEENQGKVAIKDVKYAIILGAMGQSVYSQGEVSKGIWRGQDGLGNPTNTVILVGKDFAARYNGDMTLRKVDTPRVDGRLIEFSDTDWFDFEEIRGYVEQAQSVEWRVQQLTQVTDNLNKWAWSDSNSPYVLSGVILATWVQSLMPWRPLIAISGKTNSGKTTMMERFIKPLFGQIAILSNDATEAGIRQKVAQTTSVLLLDEFDKNPHRSRILEAFRASSRANSGVSLRGTAGNKAAAFAYRHIPWVSGIEVGLEEEADLNRAIELDLVEPKEMGGLASIPAEAECAMMGRKLMAVAVVSAMRSVEVYERLKSLRVEGINQRMVESYSVPVAMITAAYGYDDATAENLLRELLVNVERIEDVDQDEYVLLSDILSADVDLGKGERKAAMMCIASSAAIVTKSYDEEIQRAGLRVVRVDNEATGLFISNKARRVLLQKTRWEKVQIGKVLVRIPGAKRDRQSVSGTVVRGTMIPWETILKHMGEFEEEF